MEAGTSPRIVTSKRNIKYRRSSWNLHEFEASTGELTFKMVALKMKESLLLWVGGAGAPALGDVAVALPAAAREARALACPLLEGASARGEAAALALHAAAALGRPVFVCSGLPLDRFSAPLLEVALSSELHKHPEWF